MPWIRVRRRLLSYRTSLLLVWTFVWQHCSGTTVRVNVPLSAPITEVVGGAGRMGSQFARLLEDRAVIVPRGVCPGSLSRLPGRPIYVCTPSSSWSKIYKFTLADRRSDLVFVGNGGLRLLSIGNMSLLREEQQQNVTMVLQHYAIL